MNKPDYIVVSLIIFMIGCHLGSAITQTLLTHTNNRWLLDEPSHITIPIVEAVTCEVKPYEYVQGSTLGTVEPLISDPIGSSTLGHIEDSESIFGTRFTTNDLYPHHDQTVNFNGGYCAEIVVDGTTIRKRDK